MEQFLLTSRNLSRKKSQGSGQLKFFEKLRAIAAIDNVYIEAAIPEKELLLNWNEFYTPTYAVNGFKKLISDKLYSYNFQYLVSFNYDDDSMVSHADEPHNMEGFSALLDEQVVFRSKSEESERCNCTWLIDFLLHAANIEKDCLREERLIWQATATGYEIVLELNRMYSEAKERQVISFQNQFKTVSWNHYVMIH